MPLKGGVTYFTFLAAFTSAALPLVIYLLPTSDAFIVCVAILVYIGFYEGSMNSAYTGFCSLFDNKETKFMSSFFLGNGTNTLVVLAIQIIVLLCF